MKKRLIRSLGFLLSLTIVTSGMSAFAEEPSDTSGEQQLEAVAPVEESAPVTVPEITAASVETDLPSPSPEAGEPTQELPAEALPTEALPSEVLPSEEPSIVELPVVPQETPEELPVELPSALPAEEAEDESAPDEAPDLSEVMEVAALFVETELPSEFTIEESKLVAYHGAGGEVTVPEGVLVIGADAFNGCAAITGVSIPEGVVSIEERAFAGCSSLARLHIPASVTSIAELDSLMAAAPQVHIVLPRNSYAEEFCVSCGIEYVCFEDEQIAPIAAEAIIPASDSITIGLKEKVSVAGWTLLPEGAQDTVSYRAKSSKIVSVNADGVVSGKRTGTTEILLTSSSGLTASVQVTVKREPSSVSISASRTTLGQGETLQLGYKLSKGSAGAVCFESLNPEIATVTEGGLVTAIAPGKATMRARAYNGKSKTLELTVCAAPVEVIPEKTEIHIGQRDSWTLAYALNAGAAGSVGFASSDEAVATVTQDGSISALTEGEAEITLRAYNGVSAVVRVIVVPEPTDIALKADRTTIGIKETLRLNPMITPEGTVGTLKWKSSKTSVATVNSEGVVTAKKEGTVTITATAYNGLNASVKLTVRRAPSSVSISAARTTLGQGETLQLGYKLSKGSAGAVCFESLNPEIATVTEDGLVTAIAPGKATMRARAYNGKSKTLELTVCAAPVEVIPEKTEIHIGQRDSWTLAYALNAGAAGSVSFASSDEAVATVTQDGSISALTEGEAEITLRAYNGVSAVVRVIVVPEPTDIALKADRTTIGIKETLRLNPMITPEGTVGTLKWKSSKTSVATVNSEGVVTAKKEGTVTITATAYNGLSASLKLTVRRAPSSVSISAGRKLLGQGETLQIGYKLSSNSAGAVRFESLNPEIATVTEDGWITALTPGTATICARAFNGRAGNTSITVASAPESISVAAAEARIGKGDHWKLGYALNEGSAGSVCFASSNESIATVDPDGTIHAVEEGTVQITAETYNGVSATCDVSIVPEPTEISISAEKAVIGIKETLQLNPMITPEGTVGTLKWKSSKTSVATVNSDGVVTAHKAGVAILSVSTYNNITASIKITVRKAPSSVSIQAERKVLGQGETAKLGYALSKGSAGEVRFESLNPEILSVTPQGDMTANKPGTAMIRATTYNGKKRSMAIQVVNAPEVLDLSAVTHSIGVGDSWKLECHLNEGSAGAVDFESSAPEIASVDSKGKITAHAEGVATVSARAYNGVGNTCTIIVVPAPTGIDVSALRTTLGLKERVQLTPVLLPEESTGGLKFKSSRASVASVNSEGVLTANKTGTATITISTYNGVSKSFIVKVVKAATGVKLSAERTNLGVGEETVFTAAITGSGAGGFSFESSDANVLSIDATSGHAIALAPGQARVAVRTYNGRIDTVTVTVTPAPTGIQLTPNPLTIGMGDTAMLTARLEGGSAGYYTFSSSDPSVVRVDAQTGVLEAVSMGSAVITATAYNGASGTARVDVIEPIGILNLRNLERNADGTFSLTLTCGEEVQLEPDPGDYTSISCTYSAANGAVNVSSEGKITAKQKGACRVTVTAYSGASAVVEVRVIRLLDRYPEVHTIMHAMGAVDGKTYSNSREAFLVNYAKGNRMFEVDLQFTSDGELVLWHNWNSNRINSKVKAGYIPTEAEFASMRIYDQYDSLTYRDLLSLMDEYPDAYFYIDNKKVNATDVRMQFRKMVSVAKGMGLAHTLDRMVITIYNEGMYDIINSIYPFQTYVLMGYKYFVKPPTVDSLSKAMQFCVKKGIDIISMWDYWWKPEFMEMAEAYGLDVNLHTVNSADAAREYAQQGVKLITTDALSASML